MAYLGCHIRGCLILASPILGRYAVAGLFVGIINSVDSVKSVHSVHNVHIVDTVDIVDIVDTVDTLDTVHAVDKGIQPRCYWGSVPSGGYFSSKKPF